MPTIRDIAKVACVSISTVSHVVNKTRYAHFDPVLLKRQLESFSHLQPSIVVGMPTDDTLTAEPFRNLIGTSKLLFLGQVPQGFTPKDYVSCISNNNREYGRYAAQA